MVAAMVLGILHLGSQSSSAVEFCNTTPIVGTGGIGPAAPYPSPITVSGLTGTVTDVNVRLLDVRTRGDNNSPPQHWVEDADVMVSAPNNAGVILMSDAGGDNNETSGPVVDADLTFDQQAPTQLPADTGPLTSGTYRPVDDDDDVGAQVPANDDNWPAPAPAPTSTSLDTFNGIDPNGTWNLWMVDDQTQAGVNINGGWCIDIITTGGGTPTTVTPTTATPTTMTPTTMTPTTMTPTTMTPTTMTPTTVTPTTMTPTTMTPTTMTPTPTTSAPTTTSTTFPAGTCGGLTPTIVGSGGDDNLVGTAGPDVIAGGGGADTIAGLGGDDVICGGDGNDQILGGDGADRIFGDAGIDQIYGENGADTVSGGADSDRLFGGNDNDALSGDAGIDQCIGEAGTDTAAGCELVIDVP